MINKLLHISGVMILLIVLLLTAGCGSQVVEVRDAEDGGQVELKVGEVLTVTLESNPTTGYSWEIVQTDEAVLSQQGEVEYQQSPQSQGLVGAGGTETFRFKAVGPGKITLKLIYHRSWEKGVEPIQTYTLQVVVR